MNELIEQLKRDEGLRLTAYSDSVGIKTIGYGHNLVAHGQEDIDSCTQEQADEWLKEDAQSACDSLAQHKPWTSELDPVRLAVLQNMTFNLGIGSLLKFQRMFGHLYVHDYQSAAQAMLDSKWATQVGPRAQRLAAQLVTGVWTR